MIEFLLVKTNDLKCQAMMITMAGSAVFAFYLERGMIPFVKVKAGFKLGMAGKTFVIGDLVAQGMAIGAVGDAFQVRMNRSQFPG